MPTSGGVSRGSIWSWRSDSSFHFAGTRYEIPARIVLTLNQRPVNTKVCLERNLVFDLVVVIRGTGDGMAWRHYKLYVER